MIMTMIKLVRVLLRLLLNLLLLIVLINTIARVVRQFHKFPMPEFMANIIDNPWRRRIQPPGEMPLRHGIEPGMTVLEVGPGNGRYSVATAQWLGPNGKLVSVDIEPKMIERLRQRAAEKNLGNVDARIADVYDLPFNENSFDAAYMITVIGEIPDPERAMQEFQRVLKPQGTLAFSELMPDPDYPRASTLIQQATGAGFRLREQLGNAFAYTLLFEKVAW